MVTRLLNNENFNMGTKMGTLFEAASLKRQTRLGGDSSLDDRLPTRGIFRARDNGRLPAANKSVGFIYSA